MFEALKIIHFLGLAAGIGAGLANMVAAMKLGAVPAEARPMVGGYRITLGQISTIGLILLWITGIWMVAAYMDPAIKGNLVFQLKIVAVIGLTIMAVLSNLTVAKARKAGTPPDPQRMKMLGMISMVFSLSALILAVAVFN